MEPVTERLIVGVATAVLLGGGGWFGNGEVKKAEREASKSEKAASALATHYVPALARCEQQFDAQRKICLDMIEAERENTAQWRAQCGG